MTPYSAMTKTQRKIEIDARYYKRHKEKILERVSRYQKEHPESHRKASREYERKKRIKEV